MRAITALVAFVLLSLSLQAQRDPALSGIEGTVVDSRSGRPLAGVSLIANGQAQGEPSVVTTWADGKFIFWNLALDRVSLTGTKPGYAVKNLPIALGAGTRVTDFVMRLDPTGVISGRVFDTKGKPAVLALVQIQTYVRNPSGNQDTISVSTNDRGEFRVSDLAPGQYLAAFSSTIRTIGRGFNPPESGSAGPILYPGVVEIGSAAPIQVKSGEETRLSDVTLTASRLGTVRFRVLNETGEAPPNNVAFGFLGGRRAPGTGLSITANETWNRELVREYWLLMPGIYSVAVGWTTSEGTLVTAAASFEFTGANIDVDLKVSKPEGSLRGRILAESASEIPLTDLLTVRVSPGRVASPPMSPVSPELDGTFSLSQMPLGRYELRLENLPPDSYISRASQGDRNVLAEGLLIERGESTLEIVVDSGLGSLQGKVTDTQNRETHGATVVLMPEAAYSNASRTDRTDQAGGFQLYNIPPGTYRLYAFSVLTGIPDAEFMKQFADWGRPVRIEKRSKSTLDLTVIN